MAPEKPARTDEAKYVVEGGVAGESLTTNAIVYSTPTHRQYKETLFH
jgi:hypothetical protein